MSSSKPHNGGAFLQTAVIGVVVAAIVAALYLVGSPAEERQRRIDHQRVSDLESITYVMETYYHKKKQLPDSLEQLRSWENAVRTTDPQTKRPYTYRVLSSREYELGAAFARDTTGKDEDRKGEGWINTALPFWKHPAGKATFKIDVTAERDHLSLGTSGSRWPSRDERRTV